MVHVAVVIIQQIEFECSGCRRPVAEYQTIEIACPIHAEGTEPVGDGVAIEIPELNIPVIIFADKTGRSQTIGVLTPAQIPSTTSYRPRAAVFHRLIPSTREAAKMNPPSTKRMRSAATVKITRLTAMLAIPARNVSRILHRRTKGN